MKKMQIVIEVTPKCSVTNLSSVNKYLNEGWLVKKVIVCYEDSVHYLLEKEVPDEQNTKS